MTPRWFAHDQTWLRRQPPAVRRWYLAGLLHFTDLPPRTWARIAAWVAETP
jgi:hypothetical protein